MPRARTWSPACAPRNRSTQMEARAARRRTRQLHVTQDRLEQHFRDMQDLEFTVERGKLYLLQTRTGKRTAAAARADRLRHGR